MVKTKRFKVIKYQGMKGRFHGCHVIWDVHEEVIASGFVSKNDEASQELHDICKDMNNKYDEKIAYMIELNNYALTNSDTKK